jgi:hypothetical protein
LLIAAACEAPGDPVTPMALFHHTEADENHLNAEVHRIWIEHQQWEFVRPRPPIAGVRANPIPIYQIVPVDETDPLSPALIVPGVIARGPVDHVLEMPEDRRGGFNAMARTIPVVHPGWNFLTCEVDPIPGGERIAYRILDPAPPPPCFQVATVYAVDLDDDGCFQPLTSVERIERASALGLAMLVEPPEDPWPFAVRPLTKPGESRAKVESPVCVDP